MKYKVNQEITILGCHYAWYVASYDLTKDKYVLYNRNNNQKMTCTTHELNCAYT